MISKPKRSLLQQANHHKLITNVQPDPECSDTFTFEVQCIDEIFTFQRLPFYNASVQDFYEYICTSFVAKQLKNTEFTRALSFNSFGSLSVALTQWEYRLYSLAASHPRFGTIQIKILENSNAPKHDKTYIEWTLCFFNNRSERKLLSKMKMINIVMALHKLKSVQQRRIEIRKTMETPSVKHFAFADRPSDVGQTDKAAVFLSDLILGGDVISAAGLVSGENGFDSHPFITGSGDHTNSCHAMNIVSQFVHLLARNSKRLKGIQGVDPVFVNTVDPHCSLAICSSDSKFKKFLELGSFTVYLESVSMIGKNINNRGWNSIQEFKVPYAFEARITIGQRGKQCVSSTVTVVPLLLSALL